MVSEWTYATIIWEHDIGAQHIQHMQATANNEDVDKEVQEHNGWIPKYEELPTVSDETKLSREKASKCELKPLPAGLKYAFLGEDETYHVVISSKIELLREGVIYPISDSKWVSPTQVVPKKSGVTVVENDNGEMVPTRVTIGWRMCTDYRKLNSVTRKDHFPLPFLEQILERVTGHIYYQIEISLEDQEKTTFTCPFGTFHRRFLQNFSAIARPLNNLLEKDAKFDWNYACQEALEKLIKMLTSTPVMQPPDWSMPFEIMCDASDGAIGAVLGQRKDKKPVVICYASRTLNSAQRSHTTTEKELLAVVSALEKFRSYILRSQIVVFTDHSALKFGTPRAIISDGGSHFCNRPFKALMKKYGITHKISTPSHPQTNGQAELANRKSSKFWKRRLGDASTLRKLQLNELEEVRNDAYEISRIYKERAKTLFVSWKIKN
ncbi:hypothetical protein Prudu_1437S000200 [Prunus dulcis]|uniref:Integrase catalytic domain-containing protein n=1 Tax=Prunus dulcis TaxID=3755 RepID=A0A5H2XU15_PRUDU|nr:hypothetical protein Prudu_1437S000200 [Prunus dulcis]